MWVCTCEGRVRVNTYTNSVKVEDEEKFVN